MQAGVHLLFLLWIVGIARAQTGEPTQEAIGCPSQVDGIMCFASTDCRGGVVESDVLASGGDCCANIGLSFCDGEGCRNCFREWRTCSLLRGVRGAALGESIKDLRQVADKVGCHETGAVFARRKPSAYFPEMR